MTNRRYHFYVFLTLLILVLFILFGYGRLVAEKNAAIHAADDLEACQKLAIHIKDLKELPNQVGLKDVGRSELDRQIESAVTAAGFTPSAILSINPGAPRRVGSTVYQEKPTEIVLRQITLQQLMIFLYDLSSKHAGLVVRSLRLTRPREENLSGDWTVRITISYLIYAPKSQSFEVQSEP